MALTLEAVSSLLFKQLGPTIRRVNLMISRGIIRRVDGAAHLVQVSLLGDQDEGDEELADEVEHVQPFGMCFRPPVDSEVVALSVGGNRDYVVALGAYAREQQPRGRTVNVLGGGGGGSGPAPSGPALQPGEGGLYTLQGWRVFLDEAGNVYLGSDDNDDVVPVALATKVEAELDKIKTALDAATAPSGTAGGPVTYGGSGYTSVGSVGSSKVKAVT